MATLTFTVSTAAGSGSANATVADADVAALADALIATRYPGMTRVQALRQAYVDWLGDMKALLIAFQTSQPAPIGMTIT